MQFLDFEFLSKNIVGVRNSDILSIYRPFEFWWLISRAIDNDIRLLYVYGYLVVWTVLRNIV